MIGLNKGKHVKSVRKVLFSARRGELWDRRCALIDDEDDVEAYVTLSGLN